MNDLTIKTVKDRVRRGMLHPTSRIPRVRFAFRDEGRGCGEGTYILKHHGEVVDFVVFHKTFVFITKGPYSVT